MSKRKIVIVTEGFPYWPGENFLYNEISLLDDDFDFYLLPLVLPKDAKLRSLPQNTKVLEPVLPRNYFLRLFKGIFNFSPILPFLHDFKYIFDDKKGSLIVNFVNWLTTLVNSRSLIACNQLQSLRKEENTAIYLYWCNYPVKLFSKYSNRIFSRVHGTEFAKVSSDYVPMLTNKLSIRDNVIYIPISNQADQVLKQYAPVQTKINRLGVVANKPQINMQMSSKIRVVSISYVIPKKRIHLILDAMKQISTVDVEWVHFGNGPLLSSLNENISSLPSNIKVDLKGFVSNSDILTYLEKNYVDLFVNVSEVEGVPVSIMEALSFGIPVFATNVGGTGEVVNDKNGKLVDKDFNIKELSEAILTIREKAVLNNYRENALKAWNEFSNLRKNVEELKEILTL